MYSWDSPQGVEHVWWEWAPPLMANLVDASSDIALGRISASSPEEIKPQVNKIFTYERWPTRSDWFRMGTLESYASPVGLVNGYYLADITFEEVLRRDVEGRLLGPAGMKFEHENGLDRNAFFDGENWWTGHPWDFPPSEWYPGYDYSDHLDHNASWISIVNAINGKRDLHGPSPWGDVCRDYSPGTGIFHHLAHSGWDGWGALSLRTEHNISLLAIAYEAMKVMGHPPVIISGGCATGEFYHTAYDVWPPTEDPHDCDCICEHLLFPEGGAVAVFGHNNASWAFDIDIMDEGVKTDVGGHYMMSGIWKYSFSAKDPTRELGHALVLARERFRTAAGYDGSGVGGEPSWKLQLILHTGLFGDPALTIWRPVSDGSGGWGNPRPLEVRANYEELPYQGAVSILATVTSTDFDGDDGRLEEGIKVTLTLEDGEQYVAYTDENGEASFGPVTAAGNAVLTGNGQDFIPGELKLGVVRIAICFGRGGGKAPRRRAQGYHRT